MTTPLQDVIATPTDLDDGERARAWFDAIAERFCNGMVLVAGGTRLRLAEIEFYYHGGAHQDPFTHKDPLQKTCGRWYFHRTRGEYRGGSFKGLDITFGQEGHHGGVLLRSMELEDGTLIDGPCLCVNHILEVTGFDHVRDLDAAIAARPIWDTDSPLHVALDDTLTPRALTRTARVGLTLKRSGKSPAKHRFIMQPYRALTHTRDIRKGKLLTNLALHMSGADADAIRAATNSPKGSIASQIASFEEGKATGDFEPFIGEDLNNAQLATLYGVWAGSFG